MPARKRKRQPATSVADVDPVTRFGRLLREDAERERAERELVERRRAEAEEDARRAAEHAESLVVARRELEAAIAAVRATKQSGRGGVDVDVRWRAAKAKVIELETGAPPPWSSPLSGDDPQPAP